MTDECGNSEMVAGLDLGTTFFKVGLYDRTGRCRGLGRRAFEKDRTESGHCEVPVERFYQILKGALDDAVAAGGCERSDIKGVSYASQANSFLLLDEHDEPLTPIIVWQDGRADPAPEHIQAFWNQQHVLDATGLGLFGPKWMVAKLDWFGRERPEIWSRCRKVVTLSDFLAFLVTGRHIGDSGTASLLGLWDLPGQSYYDPALELLGLAEEQLPELHRPGSFTLPVDASCCAWLGLRPDVSFTVGGLDHHTAALGAGIGNVAPVSVSFGTSLVCFRCMDNYAPGIGCCMGPLTDGEGFYQISFCSPGTSVLDGYKHEYADQISYEELLHSAQDIKPGADGLSADITDGVLRFSGQRESHGRGDYVRAIMELTGRNTASLIDDLRMDDAFREHPVILAVGGGARSELWMRVISDVSGIEVIRACPPDAASKGAAMLSAVGIGWFEDVAECAGEWCKGSVKSRMKE